MKTFLVIFWCCLSLTAIGSPLGAQASTSRDSGALDSDFPVYPSIKPNVEFWIDIFTKYAKDQGVIHDNRRLDIVYAIVSLDPSPTLTATTRNTALKTATIEKYRRILTFLATGESPSSKEAQRVAALFGPKSSPRDFGEAAHNLRCQTGLKKEFSEGLMRSGAVVDEFRRIFRSHGLPLDLVYLPCVESSFDFTAYSKLGAAGIWQFTHTTGMEYMNIDYVVDERRDPYISTDAAARLLKKNYAELKEWPMAITAYNHGLGGMLRARKAAGSFENIVRSYQGPSFKFASRNFYAEFLAARAVAKSPEKYFDNFTYHKPISFQVVKTKGYLPINHLSTSLNLTIEEIQHLNPSLRKPVFSEQKYIPRGFDLRLPKTLAFPDVHSLLAKLYLGSQKPSRFHAVRKGETASAIARLHSISLNELISANGLNKRAAIVIGQNLRIPSRGENSPVKKQPAIALAQKPIQKEPAVKGTLPPKDSSTLILEKPGEKESAQAASVEPAQNLSSELMAAPPVAEPGKNMTAINPAIITSNLKILQTQQQGKLTIGTINVEPEETLGHYADWLEVSIEQIKELNKFKKGAPISVDQHIKIPLKKKIPGI